VCYSRLLRNSDEDEHQKRKVDSESSSSEDERDGTWTENGDEMNAPKKKKKEKKVQSSSESESDESEAEFNDGFDADLLGDAEDREKLDGLTEVQREQILFERREKREALKRRWEIEKKIRQRARAEKKRKKQQNSSDSDSDSEPSTLTSDRKKTIDKNRKHVGVLQNLVEERKRKEEQKKRLDDEHKSKTLDVKDVFSDDDSSEDENNKGNYFSGDSDSSDGHRGASSEDEPSRNKHEDPIAIKRRQKVESKDELKRAKISRFRLAQWLHMKWFQNTVRGCYVRVNIGTGDTKSCYRIAEIVEVVDSSKVYALDPGDGGPRSQTNKALKLRIGDKTRDFRLLFISNSEWTDTEFEYWKKMMAQYNMTLPTNGAVLDKEKKIEQAKKHIITDAEIADMVKEKAKYRSAPVNFATKKTTLLKLRDAAETEGNLDKVGAIQKELEELEERANHLNRERQKDISGITYINDRIKAELRKKDEIAEREWKEQRDRKVDPFSRRATAPIMVSNTNPDTKNAIKEMLRERYTEDIDVNYEVKAFVKGKKEDQREKERKSALMDTGDDLYSAHNFDIDIDIGDLPGVK